jgi:hypothetical protein
MKRTRAVELDGREAELLRNVSVLDLLRVLEREALDALGHVRAARDCGAAAERLELDVGDDAVLVDADLQLHHVAASVRSSAGAGASGQGRRRTRGRRRGRCRRPCQSWA